MANPLKVLTALSASYGAAVSGSSGLVVNQGGVTINNNGGLVVNSNGITVNSGGANITGQLTANTGLVLTNGALQVSNGGISGSSTLQVGGTATFASDVTVNGNLTVAGTTTTVNSTNLLIADKKVVIASGSATAADATTAGIYLGNDTSAVASLQYVSSALGATGHAWTSSENLNLASGKALQLNGSSAVSKNTGIASDSDLHVLANSLYGSLLAGNVGATFATAAGLKAGAGATISGSSYVLVKTPELILSGTTSTKVSNGLTVQGASTLASVTATTVSASVAVSASVFVLADGTQLSSSTQLGGTAGDATKAGVESAYNTVRFVTSSVLDGNGYVEVDLTTGGGSKFASANLNKISVDVLTRPSGDSDYWNNDLVSVKLENSASALWVKIDAPASPNASYRLVAINESDFDVV